MELKKYKLGEVADIQTGPFGSQLHNEDYVKIGIPIVTVEHLGERNFSTQNLPMVSTYDADRLKKYSLKPGDIVFSRVGAVDRCSLVEGAQDGWLFSGRCLRVRPYNGIDSSFLYYYLNTESFKSYIRNVAVGCTMPSLNTSILVDVPVWLPDYKEQHNMGIILEAIDRKIALNREINRNLEAMARQLYDYWFVQFDFPDENGRPYKSSGGKMVWNEKLKQEIPEGWCIETLGKLANFRNGINYSKGETGTVCSIVNVRNISASSLLMDGEEFDKIEIANGKEQNYYISDEDIIIARSGCPGATRILWQPNNTIFCGFIICCKPNDIDYRFLITFKLKQLEGTSATQSGGSILQNVSQDTLKRVLVLLPNRVVLSSFNQVIKELLLKLYLSINETQLLEHQRDHLLPLLMNGQVSVMPREVNCDLSHD